MAGTDVNNLLPTAALYAVKRGLPRLLAPLCVASGTLFALGVLSLPVAVATVPAIALALAVSGAWRARQMLRKAKLMQSAGHSGAVRFEVTVKANGFLRIVPQGQVQLVVEDAPDVEITDAMKALLTVPGATGGLNGFRTLRTLLIIHRHGEAVAFQGSPEACHGVARQLARHGLSSRVVGE